MAGSSSQEDPSRLNSWRAIQSDARQRLLQPFSCIEEVLDVLLPTLHTLGLSSSLTPSFPRLYVERTRPERLFGKLLEDEATIRKTCLSTSWLQDLQSAILGPIARDWSHELERAGLWEPILLSYLAPTVASSNKVLVADDTLEDDALAQLTSSGLSVVSSTCSKYASTRDSAIRNALQTIIKAYIASNSDLLECLLTSVTQVETNLSRSKLQWQDDVQTLISLPDRLANLYQGDIPSSISAPVYFTSLYEQFFKSVETTAESQRHGRQRSQYLAMLLAKLITTGHLAAHYATRSDGTSFWAVAINAMFCPSASIKTKSTWTQVISQLNDPDKCHIQRSLLNFLDHHVASERPRGGLISPTESNQPALNGQSFLSKHTSDLVDALQRVLCTALNFKTPGPENSEDSSSEDEDSLDDARQDFLERIILSSDCILSPLTARAVALYLSGSASTITSVQAVLYTVTDRWAEAGRVRKTTVQQEQYLVTLTLALLGETQLKASKQKQSSSTTHVGRNLTTRQRFIEGVASHLGHLDPQIRRAGMLLAEVVSEMSHKESLTQALHGQSEDAPKKLQFGSSMWDGVGEGREECRVLRAMFHSWPALAEQQQQEVSDSDLTTKLGLQGQTATTTAAAAIDASLNDLSIGPSKPRRKKASQPVTRSLPVKTAPPKRGPLIMELDQADEASTDHMQSSHDRDPAGIESDDDISSSDSDSSDDDDGDAGTLAAGLAGGGDGIGIPSSGGPKASDEEAYELNTRKRRRPPIYLWELTSMLREQDRDANRVALKEAAALIRRKAGWGGEVDEQSIDLAFVLVGLQNNYSIKQFEARRSSALTALVVASPRRAVGAIIEQFFSDNTSIAQRFAVLNALAEGARELAGLPSLGTQGDLKMRAARETSSRGSMAPSDGTNLARMADSISQDAIARAKSEGEELVPEVKAEQRFKLTSQKASERGKSPLIMQVNSTDSAGVPALRGATARPKERYVDIASSVFVFPLLNRLRAHISDTSSRFSRLASYRGSSSSISSSIGIGSASLFDPAILGATLDTLSVMVYSARNSLDFSAVIAPEILELVLLVISTALPLCLSGAGVTEKQDDSAVKSAVLGSGASLSLIVLDTSFNRDGGRTLIRDYNTLLADTEEWASAAFNQHDQQHVPGRNGKDDPKARALSASARVERCTAAIILRLEEMRNAWRDERMGGADRIGPM